MPQQRPDLADGIQLRVFGHLAVQRLHLRPQIARVDDFARRGVRLGDGGRALSGVFLHAHHERGAHAVDRGVGDHGGDDLALQAVALHVRRVFLVQRQREVAHQFLGQVRVFRHVRIEQLLVQADLVVGQQDRQLRTRQAHAAGLAVGQFGVAGQVFHLPVQRAFGLQRADEVRHRAQARHRLVLHQGDGLVLPVVVPQHQVTNLLGHRGKLGVALVHRDLATAHGIVEQDLDVDLVVGGIHAGRVVDEVGVEQHALLRRLDAALLRHAEVAALADDPGAHVGTVDAQAVVGAVADVGVGFAGGLDVGTDAAVEQQVHWRLQHRAQQIVGRHVLHVVRQSQRFAHLRRHRDRLERARVDAAALGDQRLVVVVPARTRHLEQALALDEGARRIRVRVEEHVAVIKRRQQAGVLGQHHAVAEHVAGHVADADAGEVLVLAIAAQRAEVALDRLPRTARGDTHALVVVAVRAARGVRVAEPVIVADGNGVGDVGELGRALVGGDHQVRVVGVMAHDVGRMHDLAVDQVVGQVQQAVVEHLVAGDALGLLRIAVAAERRLLDEESALGADRHDDRVLDHLRLDQAQHLGAEILAPVGPAQAAARHRAEAQVDAFHPRRAHPNLAERHRLGQVGHLVRIEFVADVRPWCAVPQLEEAGAQGGTDDGDEAAQDAVLVQAGNVLQQHADGLLEGGDLFLARSRQHRGEVVDQRRLCALHVGRDQCAHFGTERLGGSGELVTLQPFAPRIELGQEQLHQQTGDRRIVIERGLHVCLRERHAGLQHVLAVAAQHRHLTPVELGRQHQAVEAVVLRIAAPDVLERLLEQGAHLLHAEGQRAHRLHFEILDGQRRGRVGNVVDVLGQYAQAEVLQLRQHLGQGDVAATAVDLEAQRVRLGTGVIERHAQRVVASQLRQLVDVLRGDLGADVGDVTRRQRPRVAVGEQHALVVATQAHQLVAHVVLPGADDGVHALLQRRQVDRGLVADLRPDHQRHARQRGLAHLHRGVDLLGAQGRPQQVLDALAHRGVEAVARHEHHATEKPSVAVAAHEQPGARALAQFEHAHGRGEQLVLAALQQLLARQGLHDMPQRLAGIRIALEPGALEHGRHLVPHQRHVLRTGHVGVGGEQAKKALLGHRLAGGVELEHADVIHVTGTVHVGARIGLGQDDRVGGAGLRQVGGDQRLQRARRHLARTVAQDAQARRRHRAQYALAVGLRHLVLAVTEEGEVVGGQPAQELAGLGHRRRFQWQLALRQVLGNGQRLVPHRGPVPHGGAHVVQRRLHRALQRGLVGLGHAVDFEMHDRFERTAALALAAGRQRRQRAVAVTRDLHHRMDHRVDAQLLAHDHADRVHQERHVVGDNLQQAAAAVRFLRIEHAHQRLSAAAFAHEVQHAGDDHGPLCRRMHGAVAAADAREEHLAQGLCLSQPRRGQAKLFQFVGNGGRGGNIMRCGGGVHGIH